MFLTGLRSAWQRRDLGGHFPKKQRGEGVSPRYFTALRWAPGWTGLCGASAHSLTLTWQHLLCSPGLFYNRKLKLVSNNLSFCLFVHTDHLYLRISKHIESKNVSRFPVKWGRLMRLHRNMFRVFKWFLKVTWQDWEWHLQNPNPPGQNVTTMRFFFWHQFVCLFVCN